MRAIAANILDGILSGVWGDDGKPEEALRDVVLQRWNRPAKLLSSNLAIKGQGTVQAVGSGLGGELVSQKTSVEDADSLLPHDDVVM